MCEFSCFKDIKWNIFGHSKWYPLPVATNNSNNDLERIQIRLRSLTFNKPQHKLMTNKTFSFQYNVTKVTVIYGDASISSFQTAITYVLANDNLMWLHLRCLQCMCRCRYFLFPIEPNKCLINWWECIKNLFWHVSELMYVSWKHEESSTKLLLTEICGWSYWIHSLFSCIDNVLLLWSRSFVVRAIKAFLLMQRQRIHLEICLSLHTL